MFHIIITLQKLVFLIFDNLFKVKTLVDSWHLNPGLLGKKKIRVQIDLQKSITYCPPLFFYIFPVYVFLENQDNFLLAFQL